ncbi:hypothetical protein Tco_0075074, partial [Tanacetum coccineum]
NCTQPKRPQNSDYFKDKMLLMQAQKNGAVLDEEELLFLADECDAFDSDVDDEPTAQSIFMANVSSVGSANLTYNVNKPLSLGGDPGHVTIQPDFFFNKDLEYLWYGRKIGRPTLSILKMKTAYYPDVGLEQMVPDQM